MMHFLQTPAWGMFQEALEREVVSASGDGWAYQAVVETGTANTRLYCPYGPTVTSVDALGEALSSLKHEGHSRSVDFIRIEPNGPVTAQDLMQAGCRKVTYNKLQPEHTQLIDLASLSEEEILNGMSSTNRNLYRNYEKKGIALHESDDPNDVELFLTFIDKVAHRTGLRPHSNEYFRTQVTHLFPIHAAKLFYATVDGVPAAAAIVYETPETRYYAHAAADDEFRSLSPGSVLLAHMIIDAKRGGKAIFDLFGIAPNDDPAHPWAGFTRFKKSFGGQPHDYLGAWDLPLKPLRYYGYVAYQKLHGLLRRR